MTEKPSKAESVEKGVAAQQHDFLRGIFWGVLLIYTGVLFLLVKSDQIYEEKWFAYFFFGLGLLMVIDYFIRMFSVNLRSTSCVRLVFGAIFLITSANHIDPISQWWPLLLVVGGGVLVWQSLRKRSDNVESQKVE